MSFGERHSPKSNATNKIVTSHANTEDLANITSRSDALSTQALLTKKSGFPNTFTTPQNCFENLTSASTIISASDIQTANAPTTKGHTPSVTTVPVETAGFKLQQMQDNFSEDNIKEIAIEQRNNSNTKSEVSAGPKVSVISENSETIHTSQSANVTKPQPEQNISVSLSDLDTHNACRADEDLTETQQRNSNLSYSDNRISINLNSSTNFRFDEDTLSKTSGTSLDFVRGQSATDSSVRNVSRLSERAKKKSWYNVLYPNYKSRSEDFKRLFKEVPNEERLIVDYSCALYRDLLIQGRLYISQNYVCFHANILGWETCLIIRWKDVTSITRQKTALVIPNAISICTPNESYFFSSFTTRDKTFLILFRVWQNTLMNKSMQAHELWQLVHNYYGDELGLTSDDEDYIDPTTVYKDNSSVLEFASAIDDNIASRVGESSEVSNIRIKQTLYKSPSNISSSSTQNSGSSVGSGDSFTSKRQETMKSNAKELTLISAKPEEGSLLNSQMQENPNTERNSGNHGKDTKNVIGSHDGKRKMSKNSRIREESTSKNIETLPTDVSDSSDSEGTNIPFVATAECSSPHEGRQLVHTILPINIETLFNLLFSKSKFLLDFHGMRKSTELSFGDWDTNEEGQKTRTVNVTVQLAASVGPKTSKVTEHQVMRDCSKPGELYSIDINSVNAGIPYADSFSVQMHYCLVKTVDDHTMLSVHAQIKYKKSIWGVVKGFIEKNTWAGLEDFYGSLLQSLQNETCIPPAKGKGRRPRRGTTVQLRSLEDAPPLQSKPEPVEHLIGAQSLSSHSAAESPVMVAETTNKYRWLSLCVLVFLCFLIIVNVILLLKLWRLEDRLEEDFSNRARVPNFSALKQLPSNHEDWIELLRQQELLHESELRKWHTVLQTAIELLKKTEKTLAELMFR